MNFDIIATDYVKEADKQLYIDLGYTTNDTFVSCGEVWFQLERRTVSLNIDTLEQLLDFIRRFDLVLISDKPSGQFYIELNHQCNE